MKNDTSQQELCEHFKYGACYPMAYALGESFGWTIECLIADRIPNKPHIAHAWITNDDLCFDSKGFLTRDEIFKDYMDGHEDAIPSAKYERYSTPSDFLKRMCEIGGFDEDLGWYRAYFDEELVQARNLIDAFLSHLIKTKEQIQT